MKVRKIFLAVTLIILGLQTGVMAQSYKSCMTYDPNRTLDEFRDLVLNSKDPFMRSVLWPEYARLANNILKTSSIEGVYNFVVTPDSIGMQWLMDHTVEYENSYYDQENYFNGVKVGNKLEYHKVAGHKSNWATLQVGDIIPKNGMYSKIACSNSEKPDFELKKQVVIPTTTPASSSSFVDGRGSITQKPDLPKDLGSSSVVKKTEEKEVPALNLPPIAKKKKAWPWIVGGMILSGTGAYFLLRGHHGTSLGGGPVGVPVHWD